MTHIGSGVTSPPRIPINDADSSHLLEIVGGLTALDLLPSEIERRYRSSRVRAAHGSSTASWAKQ